MSVRSVAGSMAIRASRGLWTAAILLSLSPVGIQGQAAATPRESGGTAAKDSAEALATFRENIAAIHARNQARYLATYVHTDRLVRHSPAGMEIGYENWPARKTNAWPDTLIVKEMRVTPIAPGVVRVLPVYRSPGARGHAHRRVHPRLRAHAGRNAHHRVGVMERPDAARHQKVTPPPSRPRQLAHSRSATASTSPLHHDAHTPALPGAAAAARAPTTAAPVARIVVTPASPPSPLVTPCCWWGAPWTRTVRPRRRAYYTTRVATASKERSTAPDG